VNSSFPSSIPFPAGFGVGPYCIGRSSLFGISLASCGGKFPCVPNRRRLIGGSGSFYPDSGPIGGNCEARNRGGLESVREAAQSTQRLHSNSLGSEPKGHELGSKPRCCNRRMDGRPVSKRGEQINPP